MTNIIKFPRRTEPDRRPDVDGRIERIKRSLERINKLMEGLEERDKQDNDK